MSDYVPETEEAKTSRWPGEDTLDPEGRAVPTPVPTGPKHVVDREEVRLIAQEEARAAVASFAGLALRRMQDDLSPGVVDASELSKLFGEALQQFSGNES